MFQNLGSKLRNVANLGSKILSRGANLAHKVGTYGSAILGAVNNVPLVKDAIQANPLLSSINKGLQTGFNVANKIGGFADAGAIALQTAAGGDYSRAANMAKNAGVAQYSRSTGGIEKNLT